MKNEPTDTPLAYLWNLHQFAEAVSMATNYPAGTDRTKHFQALALARKHARRLMALGGFQLNDPSTRAAFDDLLGKASDQRRKPTVV